MRDGDGESPGGAAEVWEHAMRHVDVHGEVVAERAKPATCSLCRAVALAAAGKLVRG